MSSIRLTAVAVAHHGLGPSLNQPIHGAGGAPGAYSKAGDETPLTVAWTS